MSDFKISLPDGRIVSQALVKNSEKMQDEIAVFHGQPNVCCYCLCNEDAELKLAIKKRGSTCFLATYPNQGCLHNSQCAHYQKASDELTAEDVLVKDAIKEVHGRIYITCNVSFVRREKDENKAPGDEPSKENDKTISCEETKEDIKKRKVGLTTLLHKFWQDAQISQWTNSYAGKRNWTTVRNRLVDITRNIFLNKLALSKGLYMPVQWKEENKESISTQKNLFFDQWRGQPNKDFLVIGELKDIEPSEHGYVLKLRNENMPFYMNSDIHSSLNSFEFEIGIYANNQKKETKDGRVICIMSCNMPSKYITIRSIALMAVSDDYIPILSTYENRFFNKLVANGRTFIRPAKFEVSNTGYPDCVMLDTGEKTVVGIFDQKVSSYDEYAQEKEMMLESLKLNVWKWYTAEHEEIPELPALADTSEV